ncbi:M56 family metallopeptidase [Luteolibacter pohnpeiensis]|uniref:M56 family metallopeptidase n=1 Tax=Luteolibacter pohnpeiensis TaxID=454153 RepID=A0A934VUQ0_9BACT|nr:M56 family metallopeptidase [Luteolibacter pohnpeiensis]MBK1882772.1 M56 family metallopeptidase [Luteolibacter pohnpeiensis]
MKSLLNEIPEFWLNFALHSALLSVIAGLACLLLRDPAKRAFVAAVGIGAIGVLPWISAMRLNPQISTPVSEAVLSESVNSKAIPSSSVIPEWTIRIERAAQEFSQTPVRIPESPARGQQQKVDPWAVVAVIWFSGMLLGLLGISIRQARVFRWFGMTQAVDHEEWRQIRHHGLKPRQFRVTTAAVSPCVVGFFRPRIVLPKHLLELRDDTKLDWAIRHEAEHLRCGDSRVAVLLSCAKAIVWWNPMVHLLCRTWASERECACDASATARDEDRRGYGNFLLELSETLSCSVNGAVLMATPGEFRRMKRRLISLVNRQPVVQMTAIFKAATVAIAISSGLAMSCAGIAWADANDMPEDGVVEAPTIDSVISEAAPPAETKMVEERSLMLPQLYFAMKLVATKDPIPEAGQSLNEKELALLMTRLKALPENEIIVAPTVTMRSGEKATIEISRELIWGVEGDDYNVDLLGWHTEVRAVNHGDEAILEIESRHTYLSDLYDFGNPKKLPEDYHYHGGLVVNMAKLSGYEMVNGETAVVQFNQKEEGKYVTALMTLKAADHSGAADRTIPGKIRVSGEFFDSTDLPSNYGGDQSAVGKNFYRRPEIVGFFSADQFETIKAKCKEKNPSFAPIELKTVEVDSGVKAQPWNKFPNFSVKLSKWTNVFCALELSDSADDEGDLVETVYGKNYVFLVRLFDGAGDNFKVIAVRFEGVEE